MGLGGYEALLKWGQKELNRIAREWAEKRSADNEKELESNPTYRLFLEEASHLDDRRVKKVADKLIRDIIRSNPLSTAQSQEPVIQMFVDYLEFDSFTELAGEIAASGITEVDKIVQLFRDWELVEAKEMMRVTEGRIKTIRKLQELIDTNALEVPTLHNFLKEFPWVLDPRWTMIADEKHYSQILRDEFPEDADTLEEDKRIDFLCVRESETLIVVEIKRPKSKASNKELSQIQEYVEFVRSHIRRTTDPDFKNKKVIGYLLCGDTVRTDRVLERMETLSAGQIYVRRYSDLLRMVENSHEEFLTRYEKLREVKKHDRIDATKASK